VYIHDYETVRDAKEGIARYMSFYNWERPHQSLSYKTPAEVYFGEKEQRGQEYLKQYKILSKQWGPPQYDFTDTDDEINHYRFCSYISGNDAGCNRCIFFCPFEARENSTPTWEIFRASFKAKSYILEGKAAV